MLVWRVRLVVWLFAVVCLLGSSDFAFGQVSASFTGIVTDPSGAAVAAANVTASNAETGIARSVVTDASGRYQLPELAVGLYDVTVAKTGFQTSVRHGIHLVVGQT